MNTLSVSTQKHPSIGNGRAHSGSASPFLTFHREMNQLLDAPFGSFGFTRYRSGMPAVEVQEAEKEYLISVDLPGVALENVELNFQDGTLTVRAERTPAAGEALYSDRWSGRFERVIGIDAEVDESRIEASLKNGVLAITVPKKPERLPRRIEIR